MRRDCDLWHNDILFFSLVFLVRHHPDEKRGAANNAMHVASAIDNSEMALIHKQQFSQMPSGLEIFSIIFDSDAGKSVVYT